MKHGYGSLLAELNHFTVTFTQDTVCSCLTLSSLLKLQQHFFFLIYYSVSTVYFQLCINEISAVKLSPVSFCHNDMKP